MVQINASNKHKLCCQNRRYKAGSEASILQGLCPKTGLRIKERPTCRMCLLCHPEGGASYSLICLSSSTQSVQGSYLSTTILVSRSRKVWRDQIAVKKNLRYSNHKGYQPLIPPVSRSHQGIWLLFNTYDSIYTINNSLVTNIRFERVENVWCQNVKNFYNQRFTASESSALGNSNYYHQWSHTPELSSVLKWNMLTLFWYQSFNRGTDNLRASVCS